METVISAPDEWHVLSPDGDDIHAMRRFLLYSHDGLGLGHVRRNLAIARALSEISAGARILVLTAAEDIERLEAPGRVSIVRLPGPHQADERVLATAVELYRPEVLLVDQQPFGASGELGPALELVRAWGGHAVLGLPDVLDDEQGIDLEWRGRGLFERIPECFSRVLVYGQPEVHDPVAEHGLPAELANITSFCGYVVSTHREPDDRTPPTSDRPPRVLSTAGDGETSVPLLEAFVTAAASSGWNATVVAGSHCPLDLRQRVRAQATAASVTYRDFEPELPAEFASLDALVCTGGYNTLAEAVASRVPTVCVPKIGANGDQLVRARAFASHGLVSLVEPDELTPDTLRSEIELALAGGKVTDGPGLDLGGDRRVAHHLLELAARLPSLEAEEVEPQELNEKLAVAATS